MVSIHLNVMLGRKKSNDHYITFKDACDWYNAKIHLEILLTDCVNKVNLRDKGTQITINENPLKETIKCIFEVGYKEGFEEGVSEGLEYRYKEKALPNLHNLKTCKF